MAEKITVTIDETNNGKRLDVAASNIAGCSRSNAANLIENGCVLLNGEIPVKRGITVKTDDKITINKPNARELSLEAENIPLNIVYQDEHLAVIDKPQGLVVHPCESTPHGTLVNGLLYCLDSLSGINGVARPGIVHRLDKNTSGLIVVAKNDEAHISLQKQIQDKTAKRNYIALADGIIGNDEGVIRTYIDRSRKDRKLMTVSVNSGRFAETHYRTIYNFRRYTLVAFDLKTGRTHQIRVHCKHIGHPIAGDETYGGSTKIYAAGQLLHAYKLSFYHPVTGEKMTFNAELPKYFTNILDELDIDWRNFTNKLY